MTNRLWTTRLLIGAVSFALCGVPEAVMAQQAPSPAQQQTQPAGETNQQQPASAPTTETQPTPAQQGPVTEPVGPQQQRPGQSGTTVDPSQGPLTPVPTQTLPESPSSTQPAAQQPAQQPSTAPAGTQQQPQTNREPLGAAAAEGIKTAGGGASRPAGSAIAPAKQRQMRSFLIKLGAIAAAGAAIGTVYALSRGTSSTPPGTR